jgi:endo-1,4-beta-mannosidase
MLLLKKKNQEYAGSGPVEGPGSGVSDSIPARLSDGEFVFTAKAVEEIGEDALMSMMKDAEAAADERQGLAMGGITGEKEQSGLLSQDSLTQEVSTDEKVRDAMLYNPTRNIYS